MPCHVGALLRTGGMCRVAICWDCLSDIFDRGHADMAMNVQACLMHLRLWFGTPTGLYALHEVGDISQAQACLKTLTKVPRMLIRFLALVWDCRWRTILPANTMWRKLLYSGFETCFGPST